jgi:hypothetical protein
MKRTKKLPSHIDSPSSRASLGGTVSHYRPKETIYSQGTPAFTLFYIQEGGVRLTSRSKHQPSAVTAILGVGDFFGGLCLVGLPLRMSTAVALTASSIRVIKKESMIRMLQKKKLSNSFVSYLLSCIKEGPCRGTADVFCRTTAGARAFAAGQLGRERTFSFRTPHYKSPGSGGDGRHYPFANQFLHEPIPETGIH